MCPLHNVGRTNGVFNSREEEIERSGDEVSEGYVWCKAYGPSKKSGNVKENWCYKQSR